MYPVHAEAATIREDQVRLGLWMFLATVTMLFAAFISAYVVRRSGSDWRPLLLPPILWRNTALLAGSSAALEIANWCEGRSRWRAASAMVSAALGLGLAFLFGQFQAWRALTAAGVYLPTNPHSSFFFVLTGAHALHVAAALIVLGWVAIGIPGGARRPGSAAWRLGLGRTFWHYLGGVWLMLFGLLAAH
jgi:cytochrome c oxidase subunit 3